MWLLCFQSKSQNFLSDTLISWYCGQFQGLTTTQLHLACLHSPHFLLLLLLLCGFLGWAIGGRRGRQTSHPMSEQSRSDR